MDASLKNGSLPCYEGTFKFCLSVISTKVIREETSIKKSNNEINRNQKSQSNNFKGHFVFT